MTGRLFCHPELVSGPPELKNHPSGCNLAIWKTVQKESINQKDDEKETFDIINNFVNNSAVRVLKIRGFGENPQSQRGF